MEMLSVVSDLRAGVLGAPWSLQAFVSFVQILPILV